MKSFSSYIKEGRDREIETAVGLAKKDNFTKQEVINIVRFATSHDEDLSSVEDAISDIEAYFLNTVMTKNKNRVYIKLFKK